VRRIAGHIPIFGKQIALKICLNLKKSLLGISVFPLLLGLLGYGASLTPSLVPRPAVFQGILAGFVAAIIYFVTCAGLTAWRHLHLPVVTGKVARVLHIFVAIPVMICLGYCMFRATFWQNSIRERMGMEPIEGTQAFLIFSLAVLTFLVLYSLGEVIQRLYDWLRTQLDKVMPHRTANVLGFVLVALIVFVVTRDGVGSYILDRFDRHYAMAQNLFDDADAPPEYLNTYLQHSGLDWGRMGAEGRRFIASGPRAEQISAFTGRNAHQPVRVYVGRAEAATAQLRAKMALTELIRTDAFRRKILVVAMPTGTGWLAPASHDPLEIMHHGDVATVAVQYSYLQSPLTLITEPQSGLQQAQAVLDMIYAYWSGLPRDSRPKFYLSGSSLGAGSSMNSFDMLKLVNDPIDGALWAGPPFLSSLWKQSNAKRKTGSRFVLPLIGDGEVVRYASQYRDIDENYADWGRLRLVFLQYASDPIVFYSPDSVLRPPEWMRDDLAPDVSPYLQHIPLVTHFQMVVDMLLSNDVPTGFGHNYAASDYIDAWISISEPDDWTEKDTARLKAACDAAREAGCNLEDVSLISQSQ